MAFGNHLQQLRREANLSQEKLAEQLHITRQAVSKWESNQALPDVDTCLRLCEALGVSPNQLLLGENPRVLPAEQNKEKSKGRFGYVVFSIFMMLILLCGTVLLAINMYNGQYFEPVVHILSLIMICGSVIAFLGVSVLHARNQRKTNK